MKYLTVLLLCITLIGCSKRVTVKVTASDLNGNQMEEEYDYYEK